MRLSRLSVASPFIPQLRTCCWNGSTGRAEHPLCPGNSDVYLFSNCKSVVHLDAEISNGAFDFSVPKKELNGSQIAGAPVDQRRLGSTKRMRTEDMRV